MTMTNPALPTAEELTVEVRTWLQQNWKGLPKSTDPWRSSPERSAWLEEVVDAGYAVPTYPVEWFGRAYPGKLAAVIGREFDNVKAPGAQQDKYSIPANTILRYGTEKLKNDVLRDVLTERVRTCLFYSEPGAGSDLAAVRTTAVKDGERWLLNGQKVWTSGAKTSDYALTIARTDWDVPKHKGLTYFLVPRHRGKAAGADHGGVPLQRGVHHRRRGA
jgi:alkylation response protein AidB-like acyl-CoA dehydrogenase